MAAPAVCAAGSGTGICASADHRRNGDAGIPALVAGGQFLATGRVMFRHAGTIGRQQ